MADQPTIDNMELWNSVCQTDPSTTKKVDQRGGFTAICAQSQIKVATETWGPYGSAWGVRDCGWTRLEQDGKIIEVILHANFFYPGGKFYLTVDMAYRPGNDTSKKLLTDLTTKALSKLGFNSDVFEGSFDDNKYVNAMREKFGNGAPPRTAGSGSQADDFFAEQPPATPPEPLATNDEKRAFMVWVQERIDTHALGSKAGIVIAAAAKKELKGSFMTTKAQLEQVKFAFNQGKYTLDTGELIPNGEG